MIVATTIYNLSVLKELVRAGADLNRQNQVIPFLSRPWKVSLISNLSLIRRG